MPKKVRETIIETESDNNDEKKDELIETIDRFFEGIGTDCTVEIYRDQPKALEGFLEKIPFDSENPIDLEYLAKTWGGRVLRLMIRDKNGTFVGRKYVPLKSYPPKMWGEEISENPNFRLKKTEPQPIQEPKDPFEQYLKLTELVRVQSESNRSAQPDTTQILLAILTPLLQQKLEPPTNPQAQNFAEMMKTMTAMKKFFQSEESPMGEKSTEDMLLPTILNLSEKILAPKEQPQPQPQPKQLTSFAPPPNQPAEVPINMNLQNNPLSTLDLSKYMEQLSGNEASMLVLNAMKHMRPQEGERMIQNLMEAFGFEETDENVPGEANEVRDLDRHNERDDR